MEISENNTVNDTRLQFDNGSEPFIVQKAGEVSAPQQTGELWSLLEEFLATITKSVGAMAGAVRVSSDHGPGLLLVGAFGLPPELYAAENVVVPGYGVSGKAARDRISNTLDVCVCVQRSGNPSFDQECKCVAAVPLEYHGNLIGVLTIFFATAKDVPDNAAQILKPFATLIGAVLEKTRLSREHRRASLMAERQAMANEIHDSLAQTLVYTKMRTSLLFEAMRTNDQALALSCVQDIDEALGNGQKSVRELITHFRCQMDPFGLQHALRQSAKEFRERTGIELEYNNRVADLNLPLEHELQVLHIVREALANIALHSGATFAGLEVSYSERHYFFTIKDNGVGMHNAAQIEGHYGLKIMRERAHRIGGGDRDGQSEKSGDAGAVASAGYGILKGMLAMSEKIRVALMDDHGLCRNGLTELLMRRYDITVVGATGNADELITLLREQKPDLLLMDLRMEPVDGFSLLERIRTEGIDTVVVVLTMSDSDEDLARALRSGVRGYLLKDMAPEDVADAVRRIVAGEMVVAPAMIMKMISILQNDPQDQVGKNPLKILTEREREVLQLLARGERNKVIALTLGISTDTVKQHVRHILTKLNLTSRVEAAVLFTVEQRSA